MNARRPEWTGLEENMKIGLDWIGTDQQPEDAMMDQFGPPSVHVGGHLRVQVSSGHFGGGGRIPGMGLVVFTLHNHNYGPGEVQPERFTEEECAYLRGLIEQHPGVEVDHDWNGAGLDTYSVAFLGVAPSVAHAYHNYGKHHDLLNHQKFKPSFDALVKPGWVTVAIPTASAPTETEDSKNLRQVLRALEKVRPILAEAGYHPDTIVAGRRGDIEEDGENLFFETKAGHGVCVPAEVMVSLVELLDGVGLL